MSTPSPEEPGGRWRRDSPEEDFEAHRAHDIDGLGRWSREQRTRPLTDALKSHGLTEEPGEGYTGRLILPDWWADIRPGPGATRARGASAT